MMRDLRTLALAGALAVTGVAHAQTIFAEGGENLSMYTVLQQAGTQSDSTVEVVDYSNFNVGATNFALAEAPRMVGGSAATTGLLFRVNYLDATAATAAINLVLGGAPMNITASHYRLSFDMYMKAPDPATTTGSTEQFLYGIGRADATTAFGRNNRAASGSGTWGWSAGEGGYSVEDYSINNGTANVTTMANVDPIPAATFPAPPFDWAGAPSGGWVRVDVEANAGTVTVSYDGTEFFSEVTNATSGFAMVGYEDPFTSISGDPDHTWALVDNVTVTVVPEPASMAVLGIGALALLRRRRR